MEFLTFRGWTVNRMCILLVTLFYLCITCCHGYILSDDLLNEPIFTSDAEPILTDIPDHGTEIHENKRTQFSVNGQLRSLAEMLRSPEDQQKEYNRQRLLKLGKRNWSFPTFKLGPRMFSKVFGVSPFRTDSKITRRRSQQLSVSGPLSALADMLAADTRRRQLTETTQNKKMLLGLGKRSEELDYIDDDDSSNAGLKFR